MISSSTLSFLKNLRKNNNKEWFDKNMEKYLSAKDNVSELVDELLIDLRKLDKKLDGLSAKNCIYRIYRDIRFSKDKTPYKSNMGASINAGGKKAMNAGYYLHIQPGGSFLAGGMWMPPGDLLKKIRQEIDYNGKKFEKIIESKDVKKYYGGLDETYLLKTTPKGYDKDHEYINYLRMNSYILWHKYSDKEVLNKNFVKELAKGAKIMKPFLDFINEGIS